MTVSTFGRTVREGTIKCQPCVQPSSSSPRFALRSSVYADRVVYILRPATHLLHGMGDYACRSGLAFRHRLPRLRNVGTRHTILPLTDRVDPRQVYMYFVTLTCLSHLGMAFASPNRFWGRITLPDARRNRLGRHLYGGLEGACRFVKSPKQSRAVAFHAGGIGAGGALSFMSQGTRRNTWTGKPPLSSPPSMILRHLSS